MPHPLALSPALRAWTRLGLDALLLDSPQRVETLRLRGGMAPAGASPEGNAAKRPASRPGRVTETMSGSAGHAPATMPRTAREPHPPLSRDASPRASASRSGAMPAEKGRLIPLEAWPAAWKTLRERRPPPPRPLVCWTYGGLGADLAGTPDPQRRDLVARMIKGLNHPVGTHVFWPFELPGEDTPREGTAREEHAPSLFWSGEALLRTRALLIMGSDARDALGLPKIGPYCQTMVRGRLFIQLPQPHSLAEKPEAFGQAMAFLTGLLRFCNTVRR